MAKRKKLTKQQVEVIALQETIGELTRQVEQFKNETRYSHATMREVISTQTTRAGEQNGILNQNVRQVNAGFESIRKDLQRAAEALNKHERDICTLMGRVTNLETAVAVLTSKSKKKVKR